MRKSVATIAFLGMCVLLAGASQAKEYAFPAAGKISTVKTYKADDLKAGKATAVAFVLNNGNSLALNGFFYSEHMPSTVTLKKGSVLVNGKAAKGVVFEQSAAGVVYPGMITYTWVLEEPANYGTKNSIAAQTGKVEIKYSLSYKGTSKASVWEGHSWAGKLGAKSTAAANAAFGYCDKTTLPGVAPAIGALPSATAWDGQRIMVAPHPIRAHATIRLAALPESPSSLQVVDCSGRVIRSIRLDKGATAHWNGLDARGREVSSGIYWIRQNSNSRSYVKKVQVVR